MSYHAATLRKKKTLFNIMGKGEALRSVENEFKIF